MIKHVIIAFLALILVISLNGISAAADSASHTVTVRVISSNGFSSGNETISLPIQSAESPDKEGIQSSGESTILWRSDQSEKKITIATHSRSSLVSLNAFGRNIEGGSVVSGVSLTTTPTDFIKGTGDTFSGSCEVRYTASASQGNAGGINLQIVTYTFTDI